jgi:hypothetical protein
LQAIVHRPPKSTSIIVARAPNAAKGNLGAAEEMDPDGEERRHQDRRPAGTTRGRAGHGVSASRPRAPAVTACVIVPNPAGRICWPGQHVIGRSRGSSTERGRVRHRADGSIPDPPRYQRHFVYFSRLRDHTMISFYSPVARRSRTTGCRRSAS